MLDRIILSFRKPFLSFYIYLLLIWLFMFIFIYFVCCFLTPERVYCKILEIAAFLEALEFGRFLRVCAHKHLPMCRGATFLHIHRGPPDTFAQIIPLNPIFMGHCFNLCWHLLSHSNDFDQSHRVLLPKRCVTNYWQEESRSDKKRQQPNIFSLWHKLNISTNKISIIWNLTVFFLKKWQEELKGINK